MDQKAEIPTGNAEDGSPQPATIEAGVGSDAMTVETPTAIPSSTAEEAASFLAERLPSLTEWVERWRSYYTGTITVKNTLYWLLQFGNPENVRLAYRLLEGLDYISESRLTHLLLTALGKLEDSERHRLLFCPVGKAYDSAPYISYPLAKAMQMREAELAQRWITTDALPEILHIKQDVSIAFLDDNCTTGIQFIRFLQELTTDLHPDREHVLTPLPDDAAARLRESPVRFVVGVDLVHKPRFERDILELGFRDFRLVAGYEMYRNALDFGGGLWKSVDEAVAAQQLLASIGRTLYSDKQQWTSPKLENRLLGYGNLGRLIAFAHNVPKSLPPVFWKHGRHGDRNWIPLFPERAEWQAYRSSIEQREEYMDYFAALIDSGHFGRARPVCTADLIESEPGEVAVVEPLNSELQAWFVTEWVGNRTPLQHKNFEPRFGVYSALSFGDPTERDIAKYNKEVDAYNATFPVYADRVRRAVERISSAFSLTFRIRNSGSAPATEVLFRVELPESLEFDTEIGSMPAVPRYPALPDARRMTIDPSILRNPVVASLERISEKMEDRQAGAVRQRLVINGPRRFVEARIGRVLHHTFIDVTLSYFFTDATLSEPVLRHELIFAEGSRPVQGSVPILIRRGRNIHPHAWELIKPPSGKTPDDI